MRPTPMSAIFALALAVTAPAMAASLKDVAPYPEAEKALPARSSTSQRKPMSLPTSSKFWRARHCWSTATSSVWAAAWRSVRSKAGATATTDWTRSVARPAP